MGKCTEIYYGLDGKPSPHYYEVLKKSGKEAAEISYAQHMLENNIKFSEEAKESPRDLLKNMQTSYDPKARRATELRESLHVTKFDEITAAKSTLMAEARKAYMANHPEASAKEVGEFVNTALNLSDNTKWKERIDATIREMKASAVGGTIFHKAAEEALLVLSDAIKEIRSKGDSNKELKFEMLFSDDNNALYNITKQYDMVGLYAAVNNVVKEVINNINVLANKWGIDATNLDILPECRINNKDMDMNGTMDVLVHDTTSNKVWIFDYKTKGAKSYNNLLYTDSAGYKAPFANTKKNSINDTMIQLSMYGAAVEALGFDVQGATMIAVRGYTTLDSHIKKDAPIADRKYVYQLDTSRDKGVTSINLDLQMHDAYSYAAKKDFEAILHERESNGTFSKMKSWAYTEGEEPPEILNSILNNESKYVERRMAELQKTPDGGIVFYRMVKNGFRTYSVKLKGEEAKDFMKNIDDYKKELKENYSRFMKEKKQLPSKIVTWFNAGKDINKAKFYGSINAVEGLLRGVSPEEYTLHVAANYNAERFGDLGNDVLIAINKKSNSIVLLDVLTATNKNLNFSNATDKRGTNRTNMFGKYITDADLPFESDISSLFSVKGTLFELYSMKLAVAGMRYKEFIDKNASIDIMRVASITGARSDVASYTMGTEITKLRKFQQLDDNFPKELSYLLDKLPEDASLVFSTDKLGALAELLSVKAPRVNELYRLRPSINEYSREIVKLVTEAKVFNPEKTLELEKNVGRLYVNMYNSIAASRSNKIFPDASNTKLWEQSQALNTIREALMQLINVDTLKKHILMEGKFSELYPIRSLVDAPDYMAQKFATQRSKYFRLTSMQIENDLAAHKQHLKALSKDGVKYLSRDMNKRFFLSPDFKKGEEASWMILKDPDDKNNGLTSAENNYLRYVITEIDKAYNRIITSENGRTLLKEGIAKGVVPVIKTAHSISTKDLKSFFKSVSETLTPRGREYVTTDKEFTESTAKNYTVKFESELDNGGLQFSDKRRDGLGLTAGVEGIDKTRIEIRLPLILHELQVEAAKKEYISSLTDITNAIIDELYYKELKDNWKTDKSVEFIKTIYEMTVNNSYKNEKIGKTLDKFRALVSTSLFSFNIQQMSTETFTAAIRGTSIVTQQQLVKWWGGNQRFNSKDATWASRALFSSLNTKDDFIYQMAMDAQVLHPDIREYGRSSYTKFNKVESIKRALIMGGNTAAHNQFRILTFTAMAKHDGVANAYKYNAKGEKVYDETADKRYYVYDESKRIKGGKKAMPKEGTKDYDKWMLWKAKREALAKEGMIDSETGRMKIPYTAEERERMSRYISRTYGSMRDDAKTMWDYMAIPRQFTLYKRWISVKVTNYWTPTHPDVLHAKWVKNENNEFVWKLGDMEGILQTVGAIGKRVLETKKLPKMSDMNDAQIENLAMLVSDMLALGISVGVGALIVSQFEDTLKTSPLALAMFKGYTNAFTELNIMQTLLAMNTEVFPSLSLGMGVLQQISSGAVKLAQGDMEGAIKDLSRLQSYIGPLKTTRSALALFDSDFEYEKSQNKFIPNMNLNPLVNPSRPSR